MIQRDPTDQALVDFILKAIKTKSTDDLVIYHQRMQITLREMIQHGLTAEQLNNLPVDFIAHSIKNNEVSNEELVDAGWKSETVPPPPSQPSSFDYYQLINDNDLIADAFGISEWFHSGYITIDGLIDHCGLSEDVARRLCKFYTLYMRDNWIDVKNLPPLKNNRTDFYFLGMPNSGKTCVLASLLSYWDSHGIYNPDVNNPRSMEYTNVLLDPFTQGYLPDREGSSFLECINGSLTIRLKRSGFFGKGETTRKIPINIIDMAYRTWQKAAVEGAGLPDHRKYLDNQNEKVMIIVINADFEATSSQSRNFVRIFSYFDGWKIWDKTASVCILISKADKLSSSKEYEALKAAAVLFYNSPKCANIKNRIDDLSRKFRFQVDVFPYSIGECRWGQFLLNPDFETNTLLLESAKNLTNFYFYN